MGQRHHTLVWALRTQSYLSHFLWRTGLGLVAACHIDGKARDQDQDHCLWSETDYIHQFYMTSDSFLRPINTAPTNADRQQHTLCQVLSDQYVTSVVVCRRFKHCVFWVLQCRRNYLLHRFSWLIGVCCNLVQCELAFNSLIW